MPSCLSTPVGAPKTLMSSNVHFPKGKLLTLIPGNAINRLHVQGYGPADGSHTIQTPGPIRVTPLLALVSEQVGGRAGRGWVWNLLVG